MKGGKEKLRQAMGWCAAAMLAVLICNVLVYAYHRSPAWIERQGGATDSIFRPGSTLLHGTEGRGRHNVDSRGYLNPDLPLGADYTLVVGSSFTLGKEVPAGDRFVDRMNDVLAPGGDTLAVYTVAQDGFYFPDMVRCFPALLAEFPEAGTIILEINANTFSAEELEAALNQQALNPEQTGERWMKNATARQKLVFWIKETFPILTLGKMQLREMLSGEDEKAPVTGPGEAEIEAAVSLLRAEYGGSLMIFYHPNVRLCRDGTMELVPDDRIPAFETACRKYGVEFVDASRAFLEAYETDHVVPYGFSNTAMATGHLNRDGHRICAEVLLEALNNDTE